LTPFLPRRIFSYVFSIALPSLCIHFEFKGGLIASIAAGWIDIAQPYTIFLSGTKAHARTTNEQLIINENKDGKKTERIEENLPEALPHAFDLFLNALINNDNKNLVTPSEAALRSSIMESIYQSEKEKKWIKI